MRILLAACMAGCVGPVREGGAPFDPEYYRHSEHFALLLHATIGPPAPADHMVEIRPGPAPFRPPDGGAVTVTYHDSSGNELGRFALPDLPFLPEADIELLLPANPHIATVEIGPVHGRTLRFDVGADIRLALGE